MRSTAAVLTRLIWRSGDMSDASNAIIGAIGAGLLLWLNLKGVA